MQIFKDLKTEQGQKRFRADMQAATDDIIAELRAQKKANGGTSGGAKAKPRPWQYQNSNFGMGM